MLKRMKMVMLIIGVFLFIGIVTFVSLAKFYPPLNRYLFGGELEIPLKDIHFWAEKVPQRNYYRVHAKYLKNLKTVMWWGHSVFFRDEIKPLGFDAIFLNSENNKIYGGGGQKVESGNGNYIV